MIELLFLFLVIDHTGEEHVWSLEFVDELCNGVDCVAGITHSYPIAKIEIVTSYIYSVDKYGCYVIYHEWLHMLYGDWNHEYIHKRNC